MEYTDVEMGRDLREMMHRLQELQRARWEFYRAYRKVSDTVREKSLMAEEAFVRFHQEADAFEDAMVHAGEALQRRLEECARLIPPQPPENL